MSAPSAQPGGWCVCMRQEQAWAGALAQGARQLAAATGAEGRGATWLLDELLRPWEGPCTGWPFHVAADAAQPRGAPAAEAGSAAQAQTGAGRQDAGRGGATAAQAGPVEVGRGAAGRDAAGSGGSAAAWRAMAALLAALCQALGAEVLSSAWMSAELLAAAEAEPALRGGGARASESLAQRDFRDAEQAALVGDTLARCAALNGPGRAHQS